MKHDKMWYMKRCKKMLEEIQVLPPDAGFAFLRLKKKAEKYLEKARELERLEKGGV